MNKKDNKTNEKANVYSTIKKIILIIENGKNEAKYKALLSNLRNYKSNNIQEINSLSFIFSNIPENKLGNYIELTPFEDSVLTTLQLYAIYKQGSNNNIVDFENGYKTFGKSFNSIRNKDSESIDKRANMLFASSNYNKLKENLKHCIKLLKSKNPNEKINFAKLGQDIYKFNIGYQDYVRISWARDFYRYANKENQGEKK